jgi:hypothetical protein
MCGWVKSELASMDRTGSTSSGKRPPMSIRILKGEKPGRRCKRDVTRARKEHDEAKCASI